jgi:hypothetical protein
MLALIESKGRVCATKSENKRMFSKKCSPSEAVLKARELILSALENADSMTLRRLIKLQDTIRNLNFERLLEEIVKREEGTNQR